ncbi:MAG: UDP-N-acetylglucosamine 2-epimerase (non-hydrolyzing) [Flavobacteriales bacterium]|nr:UDP-N-acetylglucosamine 2-epimerase (non-hydrolyzing) [Flavobacteriales bacterium]
MSKRPHVMQVVGARPQIIKSAAIERAVHTNYADRLELSTLHTGQHYHREMSSVFYTELGLTSPQIQLDTGSGSHATQTSEMIKGCESAFKDIVPDAVMVYGDTNSTLGAALAAYSLGIPVIHVEAGLRSFDRSMPEECNRIASDHLSSFLFCPTPTAVQHLQQEGLVAHDERPSLESPGIFMTGDIMYDNHLHFTEQPIDLSSIPGLDDLPEEFILATCHRPVNADDPEVLTGILGALERIGTELAPVILPVHPRLKKHANLLDRHGGSNSLRLIPPVGFLEMIALESRCRMVITDSGGVQKEAFFSKRPCVVLREETEWTELVDNGNSLLVGNEPDRIIRGAIDLCQQSFDYPPLYGNGKSAEEICHILSKNLSC